MSLSILLADDSNIIRRILSKELPDIFPGRELILTEAVNGAEALTQMIENRFDLVFLDLTMPEKTGYEVLESFKRTGIKTNIIVLTADVQPEAEQMVRDLGAIGYMKKERPLNLKPLNEILKDIGLL